MPSIRTFPGVGNNGTTSTVRASGSLRDFRSLTGRGVQATVVGGDVAADGPALLHVLDLRSPDGLAEPVARAIPADRNTTIGMVPIGVSSDESAALEHVAGPPSTRKEAVVSFANKFRNKAQELRGRIKRNTGEVTGDRGLQAKGRADEVKSNLKQAGEKVKDAFRRRRTRRRQY